MKILIIDNKDSFTYNLGHYVNQFYNCVTVLRSENINILTLYTFSSENWERPKIEIKGLMNLIILTISREIDSLTKNGIKIKIIGNLNKLPKDVKKKLIEAEDLTEHNNKLILNLAINYGSKQEILNAVRLIVKDIIKNKNISQNINEEYFESKLFTYPNPSPDLLIRTGGEFRLSNFLLWQIAYSEIIINKNYWPDYNVEEFKLDINKFKKRERRFGKISDQI